MIKLLSLKLTCIAQKTHSDQPTQGSATSSTLKPVTIERDKTTTLPKDTASKGEDEPTTHPNSNREDHSKPPTKPTEVASKYNQGYYPLLHYSNVMLHVIFLIRFESK